MKKILFALCAVAALASCTNNEVVNLDQEAITFDGAFVDNATKAADTFTIDLARLQNEGFKVWATTQRPDSHEIVPILAGESVAYTNGNWGYAEASTQYWIPGNTYNFVALVNANVLPADVVNGLPNSFKYDAADQVDLLYAKDTRVGVQSGNAAVSFTFNHLLAKAYFTVNTQNMSGKNTNYTYRITGVKVAGLGQVATCNVAGNAPVWADPTEHYTVEFGNVNSGLKLEADKTYTSDNARLVIPADYNAITINFTIETLYGDAVIDSRVYNKSIPPKFLRNYEYNFLLELGDPGDEIKFTVNKVEDWKQDGATIPSI